MSQIPTIEQNPTGLHQHYDIRKSDGRPVPDDAVYVVLRIDPSAHLKWGSASRKAAIALRDALEEQRHMPEFCRQLRSVVDCFTL